MMLANVPAAAPAQSGQPNIAAELESRADGDVRAFYAARGYRPLWIRGATLGPEADVLLHLLETADLDGLDPDDYRVRSLAETLEKARSGSSDALIESEVQLSRKFADYVRDTRRVRHIDMAFVDRQLAPVVPSISETLEAAGSAGSLGDYLRTMGWMHPIYATLRNGLAGYRYPKDARVRIAPGPTLAVGAAGPRVEMLRARLGLKRGDGFDAAVQEALRAFQAARGLPADGRAGAKTLAALNMDSSEQERILRININRARALPAGPGRHVLVNAAAGKLMTYENGRVADSMKVVVGRTTDPTPMMAALIRFAVVNPIGTCRRIS
jgi:murein L,D-transpeptidase YcbB/YkuD